MEPVRGQENQGYENHHWNFHSFLARSGRQKSVTATMADKLQDAKAGVIASAKPRGAVNLPIRQCPLHGQPDLFAEASIGTEGHADQQAYCDEGDD